MGSGDVQVACSWRHLARGNLKEPHTSRGGSCKVAAIRREDKVGDGCFGGQLVHASSDKLAAAALRELHDLDAWHSTGSVSCRRQQSTVMTKGNKLDRPVVGAAV